MTPAIDITALHVRFGDTRAIDDVSLALAGGSIIGLLGRNGAGKSTLLSTLAGFRRPTSGIVRIDGDDPYEHRRLMSETALVRSDGDLDGSTSVGDSLAIAGMLRPRWNEDYAERLIERFHLRRRTKVGALSQGQRSALAVTIGLASRAPLTMFDEPHLGMDAPARYAFYDELLTDNLAHPRTVIVSTHLIDEIARVLEDVVILHRGRVLVHRPAVELQADGAGVDVGPIPLQDLFVSLTSEEYVA